MTLMVFSVTGAPKKVTGRMQRLLLEISPGIYVGNISAKIGKAIWNSILECECSAIAVSSAKNEAGFIIASHGKNRREPIDNYGISLVRYRRNDGIKIK